MIEKIKNDIITKYRNITDVQKKIYMKSFSVVAVFMLTIVLLFTITAAWYSNIVEVEELTFEVDSWGVDSTIMLDDKVLLHAAPGDSGNIPFKIDNNADRLVNVQFNAYKKFLPDFMQQRIYFYIDDEVVVNDETLGRIYIHDDNAYYYTLLGGQMVDNSGDIPSNAKLKWEWVYDLLGYYTIIQQDETGICTETAYIRPVQYTYESASYDEATGELASIKNSDGSETSLNDFIMGLLETDGFLTGKQTEHGFVAKEFSTAKDLEATLKFKDITGDEIEKTYYEIYVDEIEGYGIYMYLCDYNEIVVNNRVDTYIGNGEDVYKMTENHFAAVQLSCGQAVEYFIEVTDEAQLIEILSNNEKYTELLTSKNLLAEKDTVIIRLGADMTLPAITLFQGCDVIIDLNGYTLKSAAPASTMFTLNPNCGMRIYNGTINPNSGVPFTVTGATLVLKDVALNTTGSAVTINTNGYPAGSNVQLIDCTWAEGRPENVAEIIEINADGNVPSFKYIKKITDNAEETLGEDAGETAGEATE